MSPIVSGAEERIKNYVLYDSFRIPTEPHSHCALFLTPLGQDGKTYLETNMVCRGILPPPQRFVPFEFKIEFTNYPFPWDVAEFARKYLFDFNICNKSYCRCPARSLIETRSVAVSDVRIEMEQPFSVSLTAEKSASFDPEGHGVCGRVLMIGDLYRAIF